jgi:hypothetical protein
MNVSNSNLHLAIYLILIITYKLDYKLILVQLTYLLINLIIKYIKIINYKYIYK